MITLVGLTGQARLASGPTEASLNVNLLNPWDASCVPGASCYGSGWLHWGGPYSILWYWISWVITLGARLPYTGVLYFLGLVWQFRIKHPILAGAFAVNQLFGILAWPQNVIPLWFVFAGFYDWEPLVLAPLVKLPLLAPTWVWNIAFNSHTALRDPGNWFSYLWLGAMWLGVFLTNPKIRSKITGKIPAESDYEDPENIQSDQKPQLEGLKPEKKNQGKITNV